MADTSPSASPGPADETPAQRQARLRRERRNAKIQAGGATRLAAITSLSGRPAPAPEEPGTATAKPAASTVPASTTAPPAASIAEDPEEIDISQHYYSPATTARTPSNNGTPGTASPFPGGGGLLDLLNPPDDAGLDPNDPSAAMARMMQQMLGGGGSGSGAGPNGPPGSPPDFNDPLSLLTTMMGAAGGDPQAQQQPPSPPAISTQIWRLLHLFIALLLGLSVALSTSATTAFGSAEARAAAVGPPRVPLFPLFATAQVVLQTTRYFLEKGQLQDAPGRGQILRTLSRVLPEPWAGRARLLGRYAIILNTVVADALVVLFVLGVVAWWRGGLDGGRGEDVGRAGVGMGM